MCLNTFLSEREKGRERAINALLAYPSCKLCLQGRGRETREVKRETETHIIFLLQLLQESSNLSIARVSSACSA